MPEAKREAVAYVTKSYDVSERRACAVFQADRSMVRYQSKRSDDAELRDAIQRVSGDRKRFGYRRIHVMVTREGFEVNHKKLRRIYREEGLTMCKRGGHIKINLK